MRIERDIHGDRMLDDSCYYGLQTARAVDNFPILRQPVHPDLVRALVQIKKAAVLTNLQHAFIDPAIGRAIDQACDEVLAGASRTSLWSMPCKARRNLCQYECQRGPG